MDRARGKPASAEKKSAKRSYRLEDQVGHLLRRAHQRATAIFQQRIGADITPTQFAALVRLRDAGALSQNHLGRLAAMDPATTQGVVRRLRQRALIAARPDPDDRRRSRLTLTRRGRALVDRLLPNGFDVSAAILDPLSPRERATFLALLKRLG